MFKMKFFLPLLILLSAQLSAGAGSFKPGPQIKQFGEAAAVQTDMVIPNNTVFKVSFDMGEAADAGKVNRKFNSLARFINMHVAAGVKPEDIKLALVAHGKASYDLLNNKARVAKSLTENSNSVLLDQLFANNVKIYVCGQTAAYYDIDNKDLYPGVEMALSAMTAHALLQQQGYTLNPF